MVILVRGYVWVRDRYFHLGSHLAKCRLCVVFYMVVVLCIHLNLLIDIYIYNIQEDSMRKFGEFGLNILGSRRLCHLKRKMVALY